MSHLSTVKSIVKDRKALEDVCRKLRQETKATGAVYDKPRYVENYRLSVGKMVTGQSVQLPGWTKPVVFDTNTGEAHFDNWGGRWGDEATLTRFTQRYAGQVIENTAKAQGHTVTFKTAANGDLQFEIQIPEGSS